MGTRGNRQGPLVTIWGNCLGGKGQKEKNCRTRLVGENFRLLYLSKTRGEKRGWYKNEVSSREAEDKKSGEF